MDKNGHQNIWSEFRYHYYHIPKRFQNHCCLWCESDSPYYHIHDRIRHRVFGSELHAHYCRIRGIAVNNSGGCFHVFLFLFLFFFFFA